MYVGYFNFSYFTNLHNLQYQKNILIKAETERKKTRFSIKACFFCDFQIAVSYNVYRQITFLRVNKRFAFTPLLTRLPSLS